MASSGSNHFVVNGAPTNLNYTGPTSATPGQSITLSSELHQQRHGAELVQTVTMMLGTGRSAQACTATTNSSGAASCTISDVNQVSGSVAVTASYTGNSYYAGSSASGGVSIRCSGGGGGGGSGGSGGGNSGPGPGGGVSPRAAAAATESPDGGAAWGTGPPSSPRTRTRPERVASVSIQGWAIISTVPSSKRMTATLAARTITVASCPGASAGGSAAGAGSASGGQAHLHPAFGRPEHALGQERPPPTKMARPPITHPSRRP